MLSCIRSIMYSFNADVVLGLALLELRGSTPVEIFCIVHELSNTDISVFLRVDVEISDVCLIAEW